MNSLERPASSASDLECAALLAARSLALFLHGRVEPGAVDGHTSLRRHLDGQVDREAERVVQAERIGPADLAAGGHELVQARGAGLERARELLFLHLDGVQDLGARRS